MKSYKVLSVLFWMKDKKDVSEGKLAVVLKVTGGKLEGNIRWEKCSPADLSLAISYLEVQKKKLVEALEKMTETGVVKSEGL